MRSDTVINDTFIGIDTANRFQITHSKLVHNLSQGYEGYCLTLFSQPGERDHL